jgi:ketosteroid isomerase-like protein
MSDTEHPLTEKVHDAIDDFNVDGTIARTVDQFAPDAVFIAPGHSAVAGVYKGHDGIREFFERLYKTSGGTLKVAPVEVMSNDNHLVLFLRFQGERGEKSLDVTVAGFHSDHSPEGWRRATFLPADQATFDSFFAA